MNPLLAQFIPEARDLLEQAGTGMLALERHGTSPDIINDVFRAVHTLKGSSGLFDAGPLTRLVHAAEDILGEVRTGDLVLTSDIVDRLLDSLDLAGQWIDSLEAREQLPRDAEATMTERVAVLRSWLSHRSQPSKANGHHPTAKACSCEAPSWLSNFSETDRLSAFASLAGRRLLAWSFTPDEDCFFRGDDPIAMVRQSPGLLCLLAELRPRSEEFCSLDPLTCFIQFRVLSDAPLEALEEHMRYVSECIEVRDINPAELIIPVGELIESPRFKDFAKLAREQLIEGKSADLELAADKLLTMIPPSCLQASALLWIKALLASEGLERHEDIERMIMAIEKGMAPTPPAVIHDRPANAAGLALPAAPPVSMRSHLDWEFARKIAVEQIRVLNTPAEPATLGGRLQSVATILKNISQSLECTELAADFEHGLAIFKSKGDLHPLRELVETMGPDSTKTRRKPLEKAGSESVGHASPPRSAISEVRENVTEAPVENKAIPRVLRVDQSKIDSIMNLVAELIVAKNGLSYLSTRAEHVHGSRAMAREIKDQLTVIDRITQGLQVGVMSVRMMPVSQVFQRFPRLVRDISRQLGKKIELVIEGEDTEADKNVLESLADPLIHMVRNSLDHGIETAEERLTAGKPEHGTLRIVARQENDYVVIEVGDDGRGIDRDAVTQKAIRLGLLAAEKAEHMSYEEIANLIFLPGFSTKEVVSDLSGRGVGMDVVRSTVAKAGGEVVLHSEFGKGTQVTARLPLTMAVTRIVTIECCGRMFGIPMELIVETVRIPRNQIHRIGKMESFVLRDTIIPVIRLGQSLRLPDAYDGLRREEEAVMVVRIGRDRIGIIVDGFRERLEVIVKPLEGVLEGMRGFSGTSLMGDGKVLLILDLQELL